MANSPNLAFCLEYSNHKTDMMDAFEDYLRNESMVDVMLSCEGNTIKAHKMVLSAGSTYFRNIFAAFKNPFQFPVLIIKDMPFRDLKAIVEFLYRGEVVVPVEQVTSLSKSAQTLFIKGLEKYFNKSAVVNVANPSTNCSTSHSSKSTGVSNSMRGTPITSTHSSKSRAKQTSDSSNRSLGMSLRNTRRPDYRQLSNGDFNSEEENSETDFQLLVNPSEDEPKTTNKANTRHWGSFSRPIKPELVYNENSEDDDDSVVNEDDNQLEVMSETNDRQNSSGFDYMESESHSDHESQEASTSKQVVNTRTIRRQMSRIDSKKLNSSLIRNEKRKDVSLTRSDDSSQRSSTAAINTRPIKGDPDKMDLVQCQLCPRVFSQSASLSIHMKRIHSEDKEHICRLCGKRYSWRSGLYKHMKSHRNP